MLVSPGFVVIPAGLRGAAAWVYETDVLAGEVPIKFVEVALAVIASIAFNPVSVQVLVARFV